MQKRFLIVALAACAALVLGALWQISSPAERMRVRIPRHASFDEAADESAPLGGPEAKPETPARLEAPPPPPLLTNDPGRGTIWLRVIDAETNRPLANTECRLVPVGLDDAGGFDYFTNETPAMRRTDSNGLVSLNVGTVSPGEDVPSTEQVIFLKDHSEVLRMFMPVPSGFYPIDSAWSVLDGILELHDQPSDRPIDVVVHRQASAHITVRDRYGVPIPNAAIRVSLLANDKHGAAWLRAFCTPDEFQLWESWSNHADELCREICRDQLTCTLSGAKVEHGAEETPWYVDEAAAANQFGSVTFRNLPCIGVGVLAWHPRYGTAAASMQLSSGTNELNVYFRDELACELRVRMKWMPATEAPVDVDIGLQRTGPQGLVDAVADSADWFSRDWYFEDVAGGVHEAVVSGLPPGWWHVGIDDSDWYAGHNIKLAPGETRVLEVWLGEKAMAEWTPVICSGGAQLQQAALFLLGGSNRYRDEYEIYYDAESGETDSLELLPGTYTAWLPTLEPFTFTLKPGEKRADRFELLSVDVNMTLGLDLAKYLGDPDEGARLDLLPADIWGDAPEHLYALDASMREADADYDLLKPGQRKSWRLPPGEYEWVLYGDRNEVRGRVTFTKSGPASLHFGLDTLPGYAKLDVTLIGFPPGEPPDVRLDGDFLRFHALKPASAGAPAGPSIRKPRFLDEQVYEDVEFERIVVSETRVLFFGRPAGSGRLQVWTDGAEGEFVVVLPSRVTIQANELGDHGFRELKVLDRPEDPEATPVRPPGIEEDKYEIELSADRWFARTTAGAAGMHEYYLRGMAGGVKQRVPQGEFAVHVERVRRWTSGARSIEYAQTNFGRGTEDVVLELWKLKYEPCATLNLEFKGRGSPEQLYDSWWFPNDGPSAPRLYALDAKSENPRHVHLARLTEYMPGGRLEFAIGGLSLPAGKYRLVPWEGAPVKHVREFTLRPGQHETITVSTE